MTRMPAHLRAELGQLVEAVSALSGMDFRRYQRSALLRRVLHTVDQEGAGSIAGLVSKVRTDRDCLQRLRAAMMLHVTSLFRDEGYYREVRKNIGFLATYPSSQLWVAACSTGPEVMSYRILLHEAGLAQRCRVYATDLSESAIAQAQAGQFEDHQLAEYERNYLLAGGQGRLTDYCTRVDGRWRFNAALLDDVVFGVHNLLTDASFNDFQFISCRNVTMYFDPQGQSRVHTLLHQSLRPFGYLGLGLSESLMHSPYREDYRQTHPGEPLYRKIR
ncbi:Chemotaxis protein methyltransferase 1 [Aquabacterium sp. CECT 9606]|nr:Chemotaxis protein methyltransferase 1 [Aquabacterium sp. CECT 9606]